MGSYVAIATPMLANGDVDYVALEKLIEFHVEQGTHGIVAVGTTGESATLSVNEHISVVEFTVKQAAGRIQVIAGTGANSTSEAIHLTELAKNAGVDACLLVVPYYNKPTQEGLYQHYKAIAEAVDVGQILYNVPGRTVLSMANETVERLADFDNIIGIKDATGDMQLCADLIERVGDKLAVLSGDDATALDLTINQQLFVESNPIPVKWALEHMGLIESGIRLPLTRLSESCQAELDKTMQALGLV